MSASSDLTKALSKPLQAKLKKSDPEIQQFTRALLRKYAKLQTDLADERAENVDRKLRIKGLEEELRGLKEEIKPYRDMQKLSPKKQFEALKQMTERIGSNPIGMRFMEFAHSKPRK